MSPDTALLESIADRALAGEFGQVICLDAPEAVPAPEGSLRGDGRSVYQRHGGSSTQPACNSLPRNS